MPLPRWMTQALAALFPNSQSVQCRRNPARPRSRKMRLEVLENRSLLTVFAQDDFIDLPHNQSYSMSSVLTNDSESEMNLLIASLVSGPSQGALNLGSDGNFTYTAPPNFAGPVTFVYAASFGGDSDEATVTINVTNSAPVPYNGNESVLHDRPLSTYVNAYDVDGDNLTYVLAAGPYQGTPVLEDWGALTYTPQPGQVYDETLAFTVTDGVATVAGTFTVHVTNSAPLANDGSETTTENEPVSSYVTAYDVDGDDLTYAPLTQPANGTLVLDPDGSFTYTPNSGFIGSDSFTFSASDGIVADTATFTINVDDCGCTGNGPYFDVEPVVGTQREPISLSIYDDHEFVTFRITLRNAPGMTASVQWEALTPAGVANAAVATSDFEAGSGTVTLGDGESTTRSVKILYDGSDEPTEKFAIRLFNPSAGVALGTDLALMTIVDSPAPRVRVTPVAIPVSEPAGPADAPKYAQFRIDYIAGSAPGYYEAQVGWHALSTSGDTATANGDYVAVSGSELIAPGSYAIVQVPIKYDSTVDPGETFHVVIDGVTCPTNEHLSFLVEPGAHEAMMTITEPESVAVVTIAAPFSHTIWEGTPNDPTHPTAAEIKFIRTGNLGTAIDVRFSLDNDDAVLLVDYDLDGEDLYVESYSAAASPEWVGHVSFAAGETEKSIYISTIDDIFWDDGESIDVAILPPAEGTTTGWYTVYDGNATVELADSDTIEGEIAWLRTQIEQHINDWYAESLSAVDAQQLSNIVAIDSYGNFLKAHSASISDNSPGIGSLIDVLPLFFRSRTAQLRASLAAALLNILVETPGEMNIDDRIDAAKAAANDQAQTVRNSLITEKNEIRATFNSIVNAYELGTLSPQATVWELRDLKADLEADNPVGARTVVSSTNVFGAMLVRLAEGKGWNLTYSATDGWDSTAIDGWGLDAQDVADKLDQIGYVP